MWRGVPQSESVSGTLSWSDDAHGCKTPQSTQRLNYACQRGFLVLYRGSSSSLRVAKKLSIAALSQHSPLRLILWSAFRRSKACRYS